ncbi:MAG: hypothetical protein ACKO96_34255 [Flammeovirgaceae bacterium]
MRTLLNNLTITVVLLTIGIACSSEADPQPKANPAFVYFLVAEKNSVKGDSYILPLVNAADITQARAMIANANDQKIVMAEITKDSQLNYHVNKDILKNKRWSWHVGRFIGFADISAEIYDAWPEYIEDNYSEWVRITKNQNGNGVIGFWGYTIKREVSALELK